MSRTRLFLLAIGCAAISGESGCALRATTDFGPQSDTSRQSLHAGPEGLPGLPILGGSGAEGGGLGVGSSPFSSDGGAAGSGGGH